MKAPVLTMLAAALVAPGFCQERPAQTPPEGEPQHSTLDVKPGPPALENKDLWQEPGYIHPFKRMPRYVLQDQKAIWTSPFHTAKKDAKYWAIFGAATAALIATDKLTAKQLPNTNDQVRLGNYASNVGSAYSLIPLSAGFYFLGSASGSERFRETGLLGFEALIDITIVETAIKSVTRRERPLEGSGNGHFWSNSAGTVSASFPSGHTIATFALASVFAHQYHDTVYVPIIAYGLASTVAGARLAARMHFPSDVLAGAVLGWFIGDFVYGKRHNSALDAKQSAAKKLLQHVHFGIGMY
jgi:membrane-associated phospholipid phosphatase